MRSIVATVSMLLAAGWLFAGSAVYAQEDRPPQPDRDDRECECRFGPEIMRAMVPWPGFDRRARLGIMLDTDPDSATEALGVRIERVVPDGPADRAGLRAGDIIVSLGGERLAGEADEEGRPSRAARRLVERARELEPGDTVEVEYRRDDETLNASVIAGEVPFRDLVVAPEIPGEPMVRMHRLLDRFEAPGGLAPRFDGRLGGLDLAPLNPDLGRYFGAEEGVLVLTVPEDSELNLRGGDIIRAIDGREVSTPQDVRRILRSYVPEEEIAFRIMRDRREMEVTGRVSETRGPAGELRMEVRRRR